MSFIDPVTKDDTNGTIVSISNTIVHLRKDSGGELIMGPDQILLKKLERGGKNKKLKNKKSRRKNMKSRRKKRKSRRHR